MDKARKEVAEKLANRLDIPVQQASELLNAVGRIIVEEHSPIVPVGMTMDKGNRYK